MKPLDLQKTVYELCTEDPALISIMKELGFENVTKPGMLQTAGRVMTIPNGARMKGISLKTIIDAFTAHGYRVQEGVK